MLFSSMPLVPAYFLKNMVAVFAEGFLERERTTAVQEGLVRADLRCYIDSEKSLDALARLTGWVAPCLNPLII